MRYFLVLTIFLSLNISHALDIDEKLTLRFLKISNSKKTILINRGAEDGLIVGEHAKFFITNGIVARGVVEKVSPSRSIWSLYRIVDPDEIIDDKVLNLKMASPVKITEDSTKSMVEEPIIGSEEDTSEPKLNTVADDADSKELDGLGLEENQEVAVAPKKKSNMGKTSKAISAAEETPEVESSNSTKNWEGWGTFYINSLSGTVISSDSASTGSTAATASTIDYSAGLERYFFNTDGFFKNVSVTGFIHSRTIETGQDVKVSTNWLEYGGGANYHFYNTPTSINKIIGFTGFSLGTGGATIKETTFSSGTAVETEITGTNSFLSVAVGAKYIFTNGFGIKGVLDYYNSSESYAYPDDVKVDRTLAGPRVQFGILYRF